ncbi:MAG: peptide/nickel transport system substrate-binding protein [Actinomycetota bacterium]|jgi:peptide/nickel transport system substrate-binding protein/oligopeptide transport system substrate-binding protein
MRRRTLTFLAVLLLALTGVACNRGKGDAGKATGETPRRGGTLRLGITTLPSLDPGQARTVEQVLVADQLFDGLTAYNPRTLAPVPSIAQRWQAGPDEKQWDFFLRQGATFSNGRAITAADVKYTLERVAKKGSGSPAADQLDLVAGYGPFGIEGSAGELSGITAPTPQQVHIVLDQPQAELPSILASPLFGIVPRESVEAAAPPFAEAPVGSGPFRYAARAGDTITLVRAPGSRAYLDRLQLMQFADVPSSYRGFTAGREDWSRVPPEEVTRASERYGRDAFRPYVAELFYGFNLRNPKYADPRFRMAIVHAINRESIVRAIYGNTVLPLDGVTVAGVPGHQDDACGDACTHDVAKAKSLMAELAAAGVNPGQVNLDYDQDVTQEAVAKAIQASLKEAGIDAALRPKPLKEYQDFAVSGQQELFRLGWIAAYPSSDAFLAPLFVSSSTSNLTGFASADVDRVIQAARAEGDAAKRSTQYQEAERAIMAGVPVVPIAQFQIHAVTSSAVRGLVPTSMGSFDASKVWLAAG